ncbi:DUF3108 domain-containing protein [Chitinispirillales bacterium ANBcel5]|uniref:DUF3108 domain-containing protein n=1 Tax=Cellulosispirillum alkaliphilum TaxID=3039283 RepID=UPI002A597512|nr:DUF3108 domain-containing protein [Chitinispirillales bacterium ANBcel5]
MKKSGKLPVYTALVFGVLLFTGLSTHVVAESWKNAARDVESFPFSEHYIDSVMSYHGVERPVSPLRSISTPAFAASGERLVFQVSWGFVKGGYVVIETKPQPHNRTIRIGAKALSSNFVSAFFRIRNYVLSTVDADGLYPIYFEQHTREGNYTADGYMLYEHGNQVIVEGRRSMVLDAPSYVHDYLSLIPRIRSMNFTKHDVFSHYVYMNREVSPMTFEVTDRENISVDAGSFNCLKIEPTLIGEGRTLSRRDRMEIWVTDDEHKMPVKLRTRVKFGSLTARLIHYERF